MTVDVRLLEATCELFVSQGYARTSVEENRHLVDIVRSKTKADLNWESFKDEATYFGSSDAFIDRVLAQKEL